MPGTKPQAMTPWELEADEFISCNCSYGCPCQFSALPTNGFCEAAGGFEVTRGHYGNVDLTGLRFGALFHWPGPIHEGGGVCQPFVDESASPAQREAILAIMSGQDTDPFSTVFSVYMSTMDEVYEPIFRPVEFAMDQEGRTAHVRVKGLIDSAANPIRNMVTGEEERAQIVLPEGFEYEVADIGSAVTLTEGRIQLNFDKTYAQLAHIHLNNHGVVHSARA